MREMQFWSACAWENSAELLVAVLKNIWQNYHYLSITQQSFTARPTRGLQMSDF